jgi:nickel superoxide dismutase
MKQSFLMSATVLLLALSLNSNSNAHCQIPCGIYDDELRLQLIAEHITTIEKAINQINQLSNESPVNFNQLARWIANKDEHAQDIQTIISEYFLTQRIRLLESDDEVAISDYFQKIKLLHEMLVYSMKAKQSLDPDNIIKLRDKLQSFQSLYLENHSH